MKTKNLNAKKLSALMIIAIGFFTSCQKNINDESGVQNSLTNSELRTWQNDNASVATDWYNLQLQIILHANPAYSPLLGNHIFAYSGIALYEAARFEIRNSISLHSQLNEMPVMPLPDFNKKYSWVISANEAMANITRDIIPGLTAANHASIDSLEKAYNDKVTATAGADIVARSQAFGDSIASAIYGWAQTDLFNHINDPFTPPVFPGAYLPTPPLFLPAGGPYMDNCRTFLKINAHGTTIPPPFAYSDEKGSAFYNMANRLYTISQTLTDDQKNIALFWDDVGQGKAYLPIGHDMSIITQILKNSNANLATAEEAYVKAGMANWDAAIVCWRSKFKYYLLRPVTYIQKDISSTWTPFIITPASPEYPAAHAFITSAVMQSLTSVFGYNYHFTDHTYDFLGYPARSYNSFDQAADECGISRVYGGIHYLPSVEIGHVYGNVIGEEVALIRLTNNHW